MPKPSGFGAFTIMWVGQLLSALGTRMTNFALSIWVWQHTGSATAMALMMFCGFGSTVLFSPIAGSLIDKWSRKTSIIVSEIGSIAVTFILLALFLTDSTELWHLYLVNVLTGALLAIQGLKVRGDHRADDGEGEVPAGQRDDVVGQELPGDLRAGCSPPPCSG